MFKKSPLKSSKLVHRKRRILIAKIVFVFVVLILLIAGVAWLFRLKSFILTEVVVQGNSATDSADLENIVRSNIAGTYYLLFPKSNKFIYPKKKIIADILVAEKRVESLKVKTDNTDVIVTVTERRPSYVWCAGKPARDGEKDCYFLDIRGYIFAQAPTFSGNAFFAFHGGDLPADPVGSQFIDPTNFKNITSFIESLEPLKIRSSALLVRSDGVFELYLEKGGRIIFKEAEDYGGLFSSIASVDGTTHLFSGKGTSELDYADFRFGNKIFYKFIGDNSGQLPG